ncbi:MAG TPA: hypothetical protein VFE02_05335 [Candidatus Acidoferrales bacterium]|jgi:hypothetical protein|nr:hypothetical protein [Candidatus Acidoferrales bacterium]
MPVENIAGLTQNLLEQLVGQAQNSNVQKAALGTINSVAPAVVEDTFTPSAQNGSASAATAQGAGFFELTPGTLTGNQSTPAVPATHGAIPLLGTAQSSATTTKPGANGPAAQSQSNSTAGQVTNSAAAAANLQLQIQSLNASLPALGLTNTEINQIDRIAALVQNFNPAAYANLVSQFESIAQTAGAATPANALLLPNASGPSNSGNSNNPGFHVQGITLQFTGSTQPGSSSFAGGGAGKDADANSTQANSAGVQVANAQFTLVNGNGQIMQIQTP